LDGLSDLDSDDAKKEAMGFNNKKQQPLEYYLAEAEALAHLNSTRVI